MKPIHVLLIEDNPGDIRLVQELLNQPAPVPVKLFIAKTLSEGLKKIAAEHIDVIVLDLNLPDSMGIDTFKGVQKFALNIPIIIMSIVSDKETIFNAMQEGAQDYLIKGQIENEALMRSIQYSIWSYYSV